MDSKRPRFRRKLYPVTFYEPMSLKSQEKHVKTPRVMVFGISDLYADEIEGYEIEYGESEVDVDLDDYEIIIVLTGMEFADDSEVLRREKEIFNALQKGSHVCVLLLNLTDPLLMHILKRLKIGYLLSEEPRTDNITKRSEFTTFLKKFATAFAAFQGSYTSTISIIKEFVGQTSIGYRSYENVITGFSQTFGDGLITFLPFLLTDAQLENSDVVDNAIVKLVPALITHRKNITYEVPSWISEFKLKNEIKVREEIVNLQQQIDMKQPTLTKLMDLKSILWLKHNELRDKCIQVLDEIGIKTLKDDIGEEDFWILDRSKKVGMCEVKGKDHNLDRTDLSLFDQHRGARQMDDDFPALLIVNSFNKASTIIIKNTPIPSNVIKKSIQLNMLLTRTFDLLNLLNLVQQGDDDLTEILNILATQHGWLKVTDKIKIIKI